MGGRTYTGQQFKDLMNSNYYPLANMIKSVEKLKASDDIDLPTMEFGQYQLILTPKHLWPNGSAKHWLKEAGRARIDLGDQPNTTPLSKDEPNVVPLTRCSLLDACIRKCFNSEPPILLKTDVVQKDQAAPNADRHEIRLDWEYGNGEDKAPTRLVLTMVCPHKP